MIYRGRYLIRDNPTYFSILGYPACRAKKQIRKEKTSVKDQMELLRLLLNGRLFQYPPISHSQQIYKNDGSDLKQIHGTKILAEIQQELSNKIRKSKSKRRK